MRNGNTYTVTVTLLLLGVVGFASSFVPVSIKNEPTSRVAKGLCAKADESWTGHDAIIPNFVAAKVFRRAVVSCVAASVVALGVSASPAFADEYGRETEAPTLGTGESIMICVKRGPLGACQKTELRTAENENDKAQKYFRQPTEVVKRKDDEARAGESSEGNALIERLKKQSEENSEKNELLVYQRTLMNDSVSHGLVVLVFYITA